MSETDERADNEQKPKQFNTNNNVVTYIRFIVLDRAYEYHDLIIQLKR